MFQVIVGMVITIVALVAVSALSVKVANKKGGANAFLVAGAIMGTLVGGSSTIGTAQLAYQYGLSAWWFTLGGGISCIILALIYAKPFYRSGYTSLMGFITNEYGRKTGVIASAFSSLGSFISIISQLISATAIIAVVFPDLSLSVSLIFSAIIMILYVIFGGVKGSGFVGVLKMILLYISMLSAGLLVLYLCGGLTGFAQTVSKIDNPQNINFYNLFARGFSKDMGACMSLILGVITTQSYAQAIFMASNEKQAVKGALLSSVLVPPIGIGGILVGLYMRAMHPGIVSKTALTYFITQYMPPVLSGIVLGALFIAVVGTGAGLALGISVVIKKDIMPEMKSIVKERIYKMVTEKKLIVVVLLLACVMSMGPLGDTILNFSFMSMGLRGATVFVPLCFALFLSGCVYGRYAELAIILGPATVLLFNLWNVLPFDPLFGGIIVSALIMLVGMITKYFKTIKRSEG